MAESEFIDLGGFLDTLLYQRLVGLVDTLGEGSNEIATKDVINALIVAFSRVTSTISLPYMSKTDIQITPNEYSNLFVLNRVLRRLLENDKHIFDSIGVYGAILNWDPTKPYSKGNRIAYIRDLQHTGETRVKIYICIKDEVTGVVPGGPETLDYRDALDYDTLPNNIVWVEEFPTLEAFNISTGNISLEEFNKQPVTELKTFSFVQNEGVITETRTTASEGLELLAPSANFNWVSNYPVKYNDIELSALSSNSNPLRLYQIDPTEEVITVKSTSGLTDYIVSSVLVDEDDRQAYARIWKSGWVEQGGTQSYDYIDPSAITFANDTYLIGTQLSANICTKLPIKPIFDYEIDILNSVADIQSVKWIGPSSAIISSEMSANISSDTDVYAQVSATLPDGTSGYFDQITAYQYEVSTWTVTSTQSIDEAEIYNEYIYNVQLAYDGEKYFDGEVIYNAPTIYFSGIVTDLSGSGNPVDMISALTNNQVSGRAKVSWEINGILRNKDKVSAILDSLL